MRPQPDEAWLSLERVMHLRHCEQQGAGLCIPKGHGKLAGGAASVTSENRRNLVRCERAPERRWNRQRAIALAPSGAEF